jgi:hypothetical protein
MNIEEVEKSLSNIFSMEKNQKPFDSFWLDFFVVKIFVMYQNNLLTQAKNVFRIFFPQKVFFNSLFAQKLFLFHESL